MGGVTPPFLPKKIQASRAFFKDKEGSLVLSAKEGR